MLLALKIKAAIVAAAVAASPVAVFVVTPNEESAPRTAITAPEMVEVPPGSFRYWQAGAFTRDGKPADAPPRMISVRRPIKAMRHQVSEAEYQRCVAERACPARARASDHSDLPAVMVSGRDADAYASWLSRRLGQRYRLPTDEEWTYVAGSRAPDEAPLARDARDPAKAWIARYEREVRLDPPTRNCGRPAVSAPTNTDYSISRAMCGNGQQAATAASRSMAPGPAQKIAACVSWKAGIAPTSPISSATPVPAVARPARRHAISASGWCESRSPRRGCPHGWLN